MQSRQWKYAKSSDSNDRFWENWYVGGSDSDATELVISFELTKKQNVKIIDSGLHFYFLFSLYFIFLVLFYSIFRTTQVRVYQSCCHISHKTDHKTQENRVEGSGIKWYHTT